MLEARGVGLAGISVDPPEDSARLARELELGYPLLSDADLRVAIDYGVAMEGRDIAVPAVFIILPDRRVFWQYVGESITDRPSDEEILRRVDKAIAASK